MAVESVLADECVECCSIISAAEDLKVCVLVVVVWIAGGLELQAVLVGDGEEFFAALFDFFMTNNDRVDHSGCGQRDDDAGEDA